MTRLMIAGGIYLLLLTLVIEFNDGGHVRITQLKADYSRRLASDDWDY